MLSLSLADLHTHDAHPGKQGANLRFCCPLPGCSDKKVNRAHQSLSANTETGVYFCHRCKASGMLREFQTHTAATHKDNGQMWRKQRARQAFALPPPVATSEPAGEWRQHLRRLHRLADTPGAAYLAGRGIAPERATGARFAPSWYGRPAVVFPLRDAARQLVAAQGRFIDGRDDPKTKSAGPVSQGVFATAGAWDAPVLMVCEAPIDALSLACAGYPALALCGTAWRGGMALAFAWKTVGLAFDSDEAGEDAARLWEGGLGPVGASARRVRPEGAKDWNALLLYGGVEAIQRCVVDCLAECARDPDPFAADDLAPFEALVNWAMQTSTDEEAQSVLKAFHTADDPAAKPSERAAALAELQRWQQRICVALT